MEEKYGKEERTKPLPGQEMPLFRADIKSNTPSIMGLVGILSPLQPIQHLGIGWFPILHPTPFA